MFQDTVRVLLNGKLTGVVSVPCTIVDTGGVAVTRERKLTDTKRVSTT